MIEKLKNPIVKRKSQQNPSSNNLSLFQNNETKLTKFSQPNKKVINVIDFIKQKNKFFIKNAFDLKGTREFLASKEVAMRVIKLNDEIIEDDKKVDEDSDIKDIYNTNIGNDINRKQVNKKISVIPLKSKFRSNKELFLDTDLKKFKKELKKINTKDTKDTKEQKEDSIKKSKIKKKKSKRNKKDSFESLGCSLSPKKKKSNDNLAIINLTSKKKESSIGVPMQKQTQSQFLFSEYNKKLMADADLNLSGIEDMNMSPKIRNKNKLKDGVYLTQINNFNIFNEKIKSKINEDIINEEDKSKSPNKDNIGFQINSDKESLLSILSDLM